MKDIIKHEVKKSLKEFCSSDEYKTLLNLEVCLEINDEVDAQIQESLIWARQTIDRLLIYQLVLGSLSAINLNKKEISTKRANELAKTTRFITEEIIDELSVENDNKIVRLPPYLRVIK